MLNPMHLWHILCKLYFCYFIINPVAVPVLWVYIKLGPSVIWKDVSAKPKHNLCLQPYLDTVGKNAPENYIANWYHPRCVAITFAISSIAFEQN